MLSGLLCLVQKWINELLLCALCQSWGWRGWIHMHPCTPSPDTILSALLVLSVISLFVKRLLVPPEKIQQSTRALQDLQKNKQLLTHKRHFRVTVVSIEEEFECQ